MNLNPRKLIRLAATGGAGLALVQATQAATILTGTGLANNTQIPSDHGSNAPGTPNITVAWDSAWDAYNKWPNDPGNGVYQHDRGLNDPHTIVFTPDTGYDVVLTSLDLNVWTGGGSTSVDWLVVASSGTTLGSGTWTTADGTVSNYTIGITGSSSESLALNLVQTSGDGSYLAMDNLTFDQVPEPASTGLLGALCLGAMAIRRRK
jgi:hypothetical protein